MRSACEQCGSPLPYEAEAFICSFECTFWRQLYFFDGRRVSQLLGRARGPAQADEVVRLASVDDGGPG
jgi:hypothetical protein